MHWLLVKQSFIPIPFTVNYFVIILSEKRAAKYFVSHESGPLEKKMKKYNSWI